MTILNPNIDIKPLEDLIIKNEKIIAVPFNVLNKFPQEMISLFCHRHALYQIPTVELIDFIKNEIGCAQVIEIGSGNGCMGRSLGVKLTDNKMQQLPEIINHYAILKQPVITYGDDVEKIDAISAVKKYKPQVVVASWVTHFWLPGMTSGNVYGIKEEELFENGVEKYIHTGNSDTHQYKPILNKYPVKKYKFPWIISRSMKRELNEIYIFTNK